MKFRLPLPLKKWAVLTFIASSCISLPSHAATIYWQGGDGSWDETNWATAAPPQTDKINFTNEDTVIFQGTAANGTASIGAGQTVTTKGWLKFSSGFVGGISLAADATLNLVQASADTTGDIILESNNTTVTLSGGTITSDATITFFSGNNITLNIAENTTVNLQKEIRPGGATHTVNISGTVNACLNGTENRFNNGGGLINVTSTGVLNIGTTETPATLTMGNAAILTVAGRFTGSTINANSGSVVNTSGQFSLTDYRGTGSTLNIQNGGLATINSLNLCSGSATNTTLNVSGGVLLITGNVNSGTPIGGDSFLLANYGATGFVNMTGGTLSATQAKLGIRDGTGVVNLSGDAVMNILGIKTRNDNALTLNLGYTVNSEGVAEISSRGRLNLGASGAESGFIANLGTGTIGALASYSNTSAMNLLSSEGTTFDTTIQSVNSTTGIASATDQGATITLNGVLSGEGKMIVTGLGSVVLNGANTFTGGVDIQKGTVTVGTETGLGTGTTTMASTTAILNLNNQAVNNRIELSNGTIQNSGAYTGELVINQSGSGVTVGQLSLGGLSGCTMNITSGVNGDTVTTLTGIAGNVTLTGSNTIALNSGMYSGAGSQTSAIDATGGTITLSTGSTLNLKLTDALSEALLNNTTATTVDLNVTSGTLSGSLSQISLSSTYAAFKYIYTVTEISGGKVVLTQHADNTLIVPQGDSLDISSGDQLGVANKAHIFNNGTINVTAPAGTNVTLNGFEGGTSGILNTGSNTNTTITLAQGGLSDSDTAVYNGKIDGSAGIDKTGAFTQQLGGSVNASSVTVSQGKLVFASPSGNSTISGNINVANGATLGVSGEGTTLTGQSLTSNAGSTIDLGTGSTLNISGTGATTLNGNVTGSGTLEVNGALSVGTGGFTPSGSDTYNTTTVKLNNDGSLNLDKNVQVGALAGTGTVNLAGNTLTLGGANGVFDGTINGTNGSTIAMDGSSSATQVLNGAGNANTGLNVSKGTLVLQNKDGENATYGAANVASGATLQIGGYPGGSSTLQPHSTNVHLSSLTMASGSTLNLYYGNNASGDLIPPALTTTTAANIGSGVKIKVSSYIPENDIALKGGSDVSLTLIHGESGTASIAADSSNPLMGFLTAMYEWKLKAVGSDIVLDGTTRQGNYYDQAGLTHNSSAVADLLYHASNAIASAPGSTLRDLADYIADSINLGNIEDAAHAMSAASGSSITGLIMAQNNQMYDQMESIRNRTITMGANPSMDNSDAPYYHFWVQGNGGYNDLNTSRDESGYKLTTWGGTVGMDVDFNDRWSGGVAFSATFGDLKAHAADSASGDMDSYYLSLFARYQRKAWAHTLILTGGWNDMKLNRSVNYGGGSYMGHGKTHGGGFGAMYELTYDIKLNEDSTSIFQPLFNIAVSDTSVKGYDETGAGNAGLRVNKMDMTTTTLGLGGRWIGLFGSNLFGRESVGQFRANVSQELGDNRGKANVAFLGNPGYSQQVIGAKAGTTALQLGASITTPLNQNSSVFLEANADFRTKQNSVGGSIGYRYDF